MNKVTSEIVATNVVASRPPNGDRLQRRPLVPICVDVPEHEQCLLLAVELNSVVSSI